MARTIARIRTVFTGVPGTPWYSNLYVDSGASPEQGMVDAVRDFWGALASAIHTSVSWTVQGEMAQINDESGQVTGFQTVTSRTGVGTETHDPLPWATQGLIRFRTGEYLNGREVRGRIFIPGLTEQNSGAGVPQGALVGAMQDAADDFLLGSGGLNGAMRVWSKKNGQSFYATVASAWDQWAVLRSRRD